MRAVRAAVVLLLAAILCLVEGIEIYVDGSAACPCSGTAEEPFPSISLGLAAAEPNDEIIVLPGTYPIGGSVDLQAGQILRSRDGSAVTTIAPTLPTTCVRMNDSTSLIGFTLRGCNGSSNSAISVSENTDVSIVDVQLMDSDSLVAIAVTGNSTLYTENLYFQNVETLGGAIVISDSIWNSFGMLSFYDVRAVEGDGGAIHLYVTEFAHTGDMQFTLCDGGNGGAVYAGSSVVWKLNGSATFRNNSASMTGGAVCLESDAEWISDGALMFEFNEAFQGESNGNGGAVFVANGATWTSDGSILFLANAAYQGGAVSVYGGWESRTGPVGFQSNLAVGDVEGGAIIIDEGGKWNASSHRVDFTYNLCGSGAAVYIGQNSEWLGSGDLYMANNYMNAITVFGGKLSFVANVVHFFNNTGSYGLPSVMCSETYDSNISVWWMDCDSEPDLMDCDCQIEQYAYVASLLLPLPGQDVVAVGEKRPVNVQLLPDADYGNVSVQVSLLTSNDAVLGTDFTLSPANGVLDFPNEGALFSTLEIESFTHQSNMRNDATLVFGIEPATDADPHYYFVNAFPLTVNYLLKAPVWGSFCPEDKVWCPSYTCADSVAQCSSSTSSSSTTVPPCPEGQYQCWDRSCQTDPFACKQPPFVAIIKPAQVLIPAGAPAELDLVEDNGNETQLGKVSVSDGTFDQSVTLKVSSTPLSDLQLLLGERFTTDVYSAIVDVDVEPADVVFGADVAIELQVTLRDDLTIADLKLFFIDEVAGEWQLIDIGDVEVVQQIDDKTFVLRFLVNHFTDFGVLVEGQEDGDGGGADDPVYIIIIVLCVGVPLVALLVIAVSATTGILSWRRLRRKYSMRHAEAINL